MTHWLAETLIATSLLMLLALMLRPLVAAKLGARAAYLLWAAPAVRMVLPPLPSAWAPAEIAPVRDAVVILAGPSSQPVETAAVTGGGVALATVLIGLWLGGAALFFARHWFAYARFERGIRGGGECGGDVDGFPITRSGAVTSPLALGVFGRRVIVPADFAHRFDDREQRLALAHELVHHRRFDVAINFFALAMLALHWWNPIAHLAHRAFRIDQEAACDDIVLDGADADDRYAYGSALFKSAMGRVPLAACAMGVKTTLKARLARIVADASQTRSVRHGMPMVAAMVAGGVALTASAMADPPRFAEPVITAALATPVMPTRISVVPTPAVAVPAVAPVPATPAVPTVAAIEATPAPMALPTPSVTPAPQTPIVAPMPSPVVQPVPPRTATASCDGAGSAQLAIRVSAHGVHHQTTRIVMCRPAVKVDQTALVEALKAARVQIAVEQNLAEAQRIRALAAVDHQLAKLATRPMPPIMMH